MNGCTMQILALPLMFFVCMSIIWLWDYSDILRSEDVKSNFDKVLLKVIMILPPIMFLEFTDKVITRYAERVAKAKEKI